MAGSPSALLSFLGKLGTQLGLSPPTALAREPGKELHASMTLLRAWRRRAATPLLREVFPTTSQLARYLSHETNPYYQAKAAEAVVGLLYNFHRGPIALGFIELSGDNLLLKSSEHQLPVLPFIALIIQASHVLDNTPIERLHLLIGLARGFKRLHLPSYTCWSPGLKQLKMALLDCCKQIKQAEIALDDESLAALNAIIETPRNRYTFFGLTVTSPFNCSTADELAQLGVGKR